MKQQGFAPVIVIVLVAIALAVGGGVWWRAKKSSGPQPPASLVAVTATSTQDVTANWKTYRNEKYGFEVKYPAGWSTDSEEVGGGTLFTVFPSEFTNSHSNKFLLGVLIAPAGLGRKSIFDGGIKSSCEITTASFDGRSSKKCFESSGNFGSIRIVDLPNNLWNQNNEITYSVENENREYSPTFNQILSTFKFIK